MKRISPSCRKHWCSYDHFCLDGLAPFGNPIALPSCYQLNGSTRKPVSIRIVQHRMGSREGASPFGFLYEPGLTAMVVASILYASDPYSHLALDLKTPWNRTCCFSTQHRALPCRFAQRKAHCENRNERTVNRWLLLLILAGSIIVGTDNGDEAQWSQNGISAKVLVLHYFRP